MSLITVNMECRIGKEQEYGILWNYGDQHHDVTQIVVISFIINI